MRNCIFRNIFPSRWTQLLAWKTGLGATSSKHFCFSCPPFLLKKLPMGCHEAATSTKLLPTCSGLERPYIKQAGARLVSTGKHSSAKQRRLSNYSRADANFLNQICLAALNPDPKPKAVNPKLYVKDQDSRTPPHNLK